MKTEQRKQEIFPLLINKMKKSDNQELLNAYLSSDICREYFSGQKKDGFFLCEFQSGEYIIHNRTSSYLYLLMHGRCSIRIFLENGKSVILRTLNAPCLIGEMELLSEVGPYSVQALEESYAIAVPLPEYRNSLLNDNIFLRKVCDDLVRKERVESLSLIQSFGYPLKNRLAYFILENRQGKRFRIKKTMISESLGVSVRQVSNVLSDLIDRGYIRKNRLTYEITDESSLMKLAEDLYQKY